MLEKIDLSKKVDKKTYRRVMDEAEEKLGLLQRECKDAGIPVILVFEGMGAAGKGVQINRLIQALDPRGFDVYACDRPTEDEQMRPFLWRYWTKTPAKGRIAVFDRSWYRSVQVDRFDGLTREDKLGDAYQDILSFEKQLCDDGTVIMKFFLYIDKDEQKKRFKKLEGSKETSWRVTEEDWNRNKDFDRYLKMNEEMLEKTDTDYAPWVIIEAVDKDYAALKSSARLWTAWSMSWSTAGRKTKKRRKGRNPRPGSGLKTACCPESTSQRALRRRSIRPG